MKPSSLVTVILRLVAIYMAVQGVVLVVELTGAGFYMNTLVAQNGPPSTISGQVLNFNFPASSVGEVFGVECTVAVLLLAGGIALYKFSKRLGNLIGGDLEQTPQPAIPAALQEWKEAARKDIAKEMFRLFCIDWPSDKPLFDEDTGFPVELVDAPDTPQVRAGIAAYNAAMRNWFVASQTS